MGSLLHRSDKIKCERGKPSECYKMFELYTICNFQLSYTVEKITKTLYKVKKINENVVHFQYGFQVL